MSNAPSYVLLPSGFADLVQDEAEKESWLSETILNHFRQSGYRRVKPTLIEFEDSLMATKGSCRDMFRMMDPRSGKMVALRCDATVQIARLALTSLAREARPLRLAYCADIVRVEGEPLHPRRQLCQIGAELIGSCHFDADLEILRLGVDALRGLGLHTLTLDLNMSRLATDLLDHYDVCEGERRSLVMAIERKDAALLAASSLPVARDIETLLDASGPASDAFQALRSVTLPGRPGKRLQEFLDQAGEVVAAVPDVAITLDPLEQRGFDYHTGMTFSYFCPDVRREIGRGGRYCAQVGESREDAVGFSLFTDSLLRLKIDRPVARRIFLPRDASEAAGKLRAEGWTVIAALDTKNDEQEARKMQCTYIYRDGKTVPLAEKEKAQKEKAEKEKAQKEKAEKEKAEKEKAQKEKRGK